MHVRVLGEVTGQRTDATATGSSNWTIVVRKPIVISKSIA